MHEAVPSPLVQPLVNSGFWLDGWAVSTDNYPLCDLTPSPRYEKIVAAHDGYGEMVDDPQELPAALQRALKVVKEEKRQAVLNVICGAH